MSLCLVKQVSQAVLDIHARPLEEVGVLLEHRGEERLYDRAEDDWIAHLHHGGLHVEREEGSVLLGVLDLSLDEFPELGHVHGRGVDHFAVLKSDSLLQDRPGAVLSNEDDVHLGRLGDSHRPLGGVKVSLGHAGNVALGVLGPLSHGVWVLLGVGLDRIGGPPVAVPLPEDGVDGRPLDLVVKGLDLLLLRVRGLLRVVGQVVALLLELGDGGLELRHGGRDVWQLDDVGLRLEAQVPELREGVVRLSELSQDAAGQGNVPRLDPNARPAGMETEARKEGAERVVRCVSKTKGREKKNKGKLRFLLTWRRRSGGLARRSRSRAEAPRPSTCR
mmetsp:Transcript_2139/g.5829  ORF Transcript_2139/g.5829 Transcript_2139/m.5829 type:complete len:333 (+) Transcript_2139:1952-2950(+)